MKQATTLAKDLESNYNVEDIEVVNLENGKVRIFAVSDDFINVDFFWKKKSPSITEKSPSIIRKKLAKPPKAKKVASKQKMKLPSGLVNYMDFTKSVAEKLTKSSSVEDHIDDFKDSDAKQFKGKSLDKIKKMALAAFLSKQKK
jgi:hypothetical protein